MSNVKFPCPGCGKQIVAPESLVGRQRNCPRCGAAFTVPAADKTEKPPKKAAPTEPAARLSSPKSTEHPLLLMPSRAMPRQELIDMTAMVDIVFFLLIFFMVTSMQSLEAVISLPSPRDSSGASAVTQPTDYLNDPTFIVVTIDEDDIVYVEDEEVYGEQNLRSKLRAARQEDDQRTGLLVIGDPDATHGTLVSVLDAGADAGITELLFSVSEQPEADGG